MGSIVTVGYIQSLQSEESNTITASVSPQPITEICAAVCTTTLLPFPIIIQGCCRGQLQANLNVNGFSCVCPVIPQSHYESI